MLKSQKCGPGGGCCGQLRLVQYSQASLCSCCTPEVAFVLLPASATASETTPAPVLLPQVLLWLASTSPAARCISHSLLHSALPAPATGTAQVLMCSHDKPDELDSLQLSCYTEDNSVPLNAVRNLAGPNTPNSSSGRIRWKWTADQGQSCHASSIDASHLPVFDSVLKLLLKPSFSANSSSPVPEGTPVPDTLLYMNNLCHFSRSTC